MSYGLPSEGKGHTFESCRVRHVPTKLADSARFAPAFHADGPIHVALAGHFPSITFEMT
jgi:hypothetical protein